MLAELPVKSGLRSYGGLQYAVVWGVFTVVVIFIVCVAIDQLRIRLIEQPLFCYLDKSKESI